MQMSAYLSFNGDCEAAFTFYEQYLGAQRGAIFRYGGSPMARGVPEDWSEKVMHGSVTIGGQVLMGGDVEPSQYEPPKGFSLSLQITSTADAERIFPNWPTAARLSFRSTRPSGPSDLAWSSIVLACPG